MRGRDSDSDALIETPPEKSEVETVSDVETKKLVVKLVIKELSDSAGTEDRYTVCTSVCGGLKSSVGGARVLTELKDSDGDTEGSA